MKTLPHYPKVLTLGSSGTDGAFDGHVIIQEKVDGSQFRFGKNEDGEILLGSHRVNWSDRSDVEGMFTTAVSYLRGIRGSFSEILPDTYFFTEYLAKPKHNTLSYKRVPQNNLVLFDCLCGGRWLGRKELEEKALFLGIDIVPELGRGNELAIDKLRPLHEIESYLGGEKIEGVVIKNYDKMIILGGLVMPLFTKFVRAKFKEQNDANFRATNPRANVADYILSFRAEPRWLKAAQHLKEEGKLEGSPRDIGTLIKEVQRDIKEEETENIKSALYRFFIDDIVRRSTGGLPEWYKEQLLKTMEAPKNGS